MHVRPEAPMPQRKGLILCIDDDGPTLQTRRRRLEETGYEVLAASSGREGLAIFVQRTIDLVLLDYEIPGMTGDFVAAWMKGVNPRVPIIMFSTCLSLRLSRPIFVDELLSTAEPWEGVLAKVDELIRQNAGFFPRWWQDWKRRRTSHSEASSVTEERLAARWKS